MFGGANEPIGIATGDFVFVGDLGRPDLLESAAGIAGMMEPSAKRLYQTVRKLDGMADFIQVWPAHGAGSACGKALGAVLTSTIGYEKRFNPAIKAASDERTFVDFILSGQPEPPMYFANMKRVNKAGPAVLGGLPLPKRMTVSELAGLDARQVAVVDTRAWDEFRAGHVPGALSFPLTKSFNTDAGSMIREDEKIYLIIEPERVEEAVRDLVRIGLDHIEGWFDPEDLAAYAKAGHELAETGEVTAEEASRLMDEAGVAVLDVRRATEYGEGHIAGATNIAHTRLMGRMDEVPAAEQLVVHCRSGARSARACAFLERVGRRVVNLKGGFMAWEQAKEPVER